MSTLRWACQPLPRSAHGYNAFPHHPTDRLHLPIHLPMPLDRLTARASFGSLLHSPHTVRRPADGAYPADMARRWLAAMHGDPAHNATWGLYWATQPGPDEVFTLEVRGQ